MITWRDGSITHVGLVVGYKEENYDCGYNYVGYALVFNPETETVEKVAIDQEFMENTGKHTVDLLPQYQAILDAQRAKRQAEIDVRNAEIEAKTVRKGKTIVVVGGRKHKGLIGQVFWEGQCQFNRHKTNVGVKTSNGQTFFVDKAYCEVFVSGLDKALA